jgi:DNA polymerase IV
MSTIAYDPLGAIPDAASTESPGPSNRPRKIIHIDMDAFYASVEQRDNPELRGKPVAVGGSRARGVVAAASYEARRFGIHSAMASVTAKRKCPELLFVPPRFEVYRAISRQIRAIFSDYTPLVEPLALDEAYLDVTENLKGIPYATQIAQEIRARIHAETQLTASAGVSYNKFLAKLASEQRKPDGLFVITPAMGPDFVETLPIGKFHGIGPATAAKMNRLGIATGRDLKAQSLAFLQERFGKPGTYYHSIARGIDHRAVRPDRIRKSVGAENTFERDLTAFEEMRAELQPILDKVWRHCEQTGTRGRTVTLKVKFADFEQITRSRSLPGTVASRTGLATVSLELLSALFPMHQGVRLLGVTLSSLNTEEESRDMQLPLAL